MGGWGSQVLNLWKCENTRFLRIYTFTHLFPDLVVKYWMFTVTVLFLCLMFCDQDQVVSCCFKWGGNWMFQIFWNAARWIYRWCLLTYFHSLSDKLKSSRYNLFQSVMGANRFKNFLTKKILHTEEYPR